MKKKVIFGAGVYGVRALDIIGAKEVDYFVDNDDKKKHNFYKNKKIISFDELISLKDKYHVVVASRLYSTEIEKQLREHGISDYSNIIKYMRYSETDELIHDPYEAKPEVGTEEQFAISKELEAARKSVYKDVEEFYGKNLLFNIVEVETINRCNGVCSFCPVNCKVDPRKKKVMSEDLFKKIVKQLEDIKYSGRFTTFSNNEPLLDERIVEWNYYARKHLPYARLHLFTNGTLLTLKKFEALMEVLDELIIDNYQQELKLIKPCMEIVEYCKKHPELNKKVTIELRKPNEILSTRGGNAPNRHIIERYDKDRCVLPFRQIVIRPDGKISLCCNDAIGKYTLGDLTKDSLLDIWYGSKFQEVRKCLYEGRGNWGDCRFCDVFYSVL